MSSLRWPSLVLSLLLLGAAGAGAASPPAIPVQGVLLDAAGQPLHGSVPVIFSLYETESSGVPLWQETRTLAVAQGRFTVLLGDSLPLDLYLFHRHTGLWLGISVQGGSEIPRFRLGAVAFAAWAERLPELPSGLIAPFVRDCPPGWTRYVALDGRTPRGAPVAGSTAGSENHSHTIPGSSWSLAAAGAHAHGVATPTASTPVSGSHSHSVTTGSTVRGHSHTPDPAAVWTSSDDSTHTHSTTWRNLASCGYNTTTTVESAAHNHSLSLSGTSGAGTVIDQFGSGTLGSGEHSHAASVAGFNSDSAGNHDHGVTLPDASLEAASSWPPFLEVVYCRFDPGLLEQEVTATEHGLDTFESRLSHIERLLLKETK